MEVKISTIFKEFIKRHKIFTIISLFILFNFIILSFIFLISQGIALIFGKDIESYFMLGSYSMLGSLVRYKIFFMLAMDELDNVLKIIAFIGGILILALRKISIILIIGIMYLREIINEIVDKDYRKVYKIKCYLIYFFICLISKVIDIGILIILPISS